MRGIVKATRFRCGSLAFFPCHAKNCRECVRLPHGGISADMIGYIGSASRRGRSRVRASMGERDGARPSLAQLAERHLGFWPVSVHVQIWGLSHVLTYAVNVKWDGIRSRTVVKQSCGLSCGFRRWDRCCVGSRAPDSDCTRHAYYALDDDMLPLRLMANCDPRAHQCSCFTDQQSEKRQAKTKWRRDCLFVCSLLGYLVML